MREAALEHGQEVRIGDAIFKFVDDDAEQFARYRIDGTMRRHDAPAHASQSELVGGYQMDRIVAEIERIATSPISVRLARRERHRQGGRRAASSTA